MNRFLISDVAAYLGKNSDTVYQASKALGMKTEGRGVDRSFSESQVRDLESYFWSKTKYRGNGQYTRFPQPRAKKSQGRSWYYGIRDSEHQDVDEKED
jgi:hypothetical protein